MPPIRVGDKMRGRWGSYGIYMGKASDNKRILIQYVSDKVISLSHLSPVDSDSVHRVDFSIFDGKPLEQKRSEWTRMNNQDTVVFDYNIRLRGD